MKVIAGSAHLQLAQKIARVLKIKLSKIKISKFPNGEKRIYVQEKVAGETVFIIQPTINDEAIVELCLLADALKRKKAKKIIAVAPWFGYSPQDRVYRTGEPFSLQLMIKILETAGINQFILLDFHSEKVIKLFAQRPIHQSASQLFIDVLKKKNLTDFVVVCLDQGDQSRSQTFSAGLKLPLVILKKTPRHRQTGRVEFLSWQEQVDGKNILFFDDFVSTGQTLIKAADFLKKEGAQKIIACVTHYLPVKDLSVKLAASSLDEILVTNSLPINPVRRFKKLKVISLERLLAKAIKKC